MMLLGVEKCVKRKRKEKKNEDAVRRDQKKNNGCQKPVEKSEPGAEENPLKLQIWAGLRFCVRKLWRC